MSFMNQLTATLEEDFNRSETENGAVGYRTTGKELLDLNFAVASLRKSTAEDIVNRFVRAFYEDRALAMRWLFFARDIRGGLGERRLFRIILNYIARSHPDVFMRVVPLVPEYGRWDDLWGMFDVGVDMGYEKSFYPVKELVAAQLNKDIEDIRKNKPISLLGKWMPSINASSPITVTRARAFAKALGYSRMQYQKMLSALRKYLDVVEVKMSANAWDQIKYEGVPSYANLKYHEAFLRHDEKRRREYLANLQRGEAKINAGVLYPHDIVQQYVGSIYFKWRKDPLNINDTLEALWRNLPDTVNGEGSTIVVADGSGSMLCGVDDSDTTALSVANALAIYFAERLEGEFRNKYITFSANPQLVNLECEDNSLRSKLEIALSHSEVANTNIEKVFQLILHAAVNGRLPQEEIPKNILIISDMEFDCATTGRVNEPMFKEISRQFNEQGYQLPRLIFWNVNSRTGTIPVKENELGVALVSGFSVNIAKMVMSGQTDPYECLKEALMSDRYDAVGNALSV